MVKTSLVVRVVQYSDGIQNGGHFGGLPLENHTRIRIIEHLKTRLTKCQYLNSTVKVSQSDVTLKKIPVEVVQPRLKEKQIQEGSE